MNCLKVSLNNLKFGFKNYQIALHSEIFVVDLIEEGQETGIQAPTGLIARWKVIFQFGWISHTYFWNEDIYHQLPEVEIVINCLVWNQFEAQFHLHCPWFHYCKHIGIWTLCCVGQTQFLSPYWSGFHFLWSFQQGCFWGTVIDGHCHLYKSQQNQFLSCCQKILLQHDLSWQGSSQHIKWSWFWMTFSLSIRSWLASTKLDK